MWYYTTKFFSLLPLWTANTPTIITSYCQSQLGYELPGVSEKLIPTRNSTAAGSVVERVVAVLKVGANVDTFQQYVGNYSYTEFQTNSTIMQESMLRAQDFTNSYLFNKAQSSLATASGQIAAFVVVSILFFLIGLIMEMMMAKTIRGPWQRLNKIQETTIKRFVPGGFLRLLGVQQISDLTLNMNKMKRIVLVQVEIKDFDKISFSIDPNRMLHVLNSVFEDVCPIVRRNQGFIDRYHTKGFSALFNKKRHAVTSALEMIKQARTLSERYGGDFPKIELIVSLQYGHALVGTVGEAERMDLILFGKIGDVTDKMMQLNKVLQTSVITSSETVRKYMTVRRLGMTKECNQIVEIYDANEHPHRKDTKADFEAGTRELEEKSFVQAHKYFSSVLEADANDETAQKLEQMCKKVIKEVDKIIETMETKRDFLLDPYMRDHLEQFCKLEMSSENLDLWKIIEFEFAKEDSPSKRRDIADTIIRDFVNLNGQYAVNISESTKKRLVVRMIEEEFIPPKDFFYDLQKEMVANISDTVIRYKKTQDCQIAYMKRYTENMELLL
jgi:class 3 adenylate cyclase/phosphoribosylformylglycinamidine (FGAM) synthase PurS component